MQLYNARKRRGKLHPDPDMEHMHDRSDCDRTPTVSAVSSSEISSPVAFTYAAACSEHVVGASVKKSKAFHNKEDSQPESECCKLIDHPDKTSSGESCDPGVCH